MRNKERLPLSTGSKLTLILTGIVILGCMLLFFSIRPTGMHAMQSVSAANLIIQPQTGTTHEPSAETTARMVTVTMPPTALPKPVSTVAPQLLSIEKHSFTLTASGMLLFESDISDTVYNKNQKSFDYTGLLSMLEPYMANSELRLGFLPQNLNTVENKYTDLVAPEPILDAVKEMGINTLIVSSAHTLDEGTESAAAFAQSVSQRGIQCGGVSNEFASQHLFLDCAGAKVAILSYVDALTPKGKLALSSQPEAMTLYSEVTAQREIAAAREQGAECVIVCMDWGNTDATEPKAGQREIARNLAAYGADIILGTRSKRIIAPEWLESTRADGKKHKTLVAYSLGTTLCESRDGYDISGMLLNVEVSCSAAQGVTFGQVNYTPTYIWRQQFSGKYQYHVLCSSAEPPENMTKTQVEVMERARTRVGTILKDHIPEIN